MWDVHVTLGQGQAWRPVPVRGQEAAGGGGCLLPEPLDLRAPAALPTRGSGTCSPWFQELTPHPTHVQSECGPTHSTFRAPPMAHRAGCHPPTWMPFRARLPQGLGAAAPSALAPTWLTPSHLQVLPQTPPTPHRVKPQPPCSAPPSPPLRASTCRCSFPVVGAAGGLAQGLSPSGNPLPFPLARQEAASAPPTPK